MKRVKLAAAIASVLTLMLLASAGRTDEVDAVKVLEKAGSKIYRDEKNAEKPVVAVTMWGPSFNSDLLVNMKEFKSLERLRLAGPWVNEKGLKELHGIKTLKVLQIRGPGVTDAALKDLQKAIPDLKITRVDPSANQKPLYP